MSGHTVSQGESLLSIASEHGFEPDSLWNHPDNAELKGLRSDPETLQPGDVLELPDKKVKNVGAAAASKHSFRKKGTVSWLRLTILDEDEPRANAAYVLEIDRVTHEGKLDGEGKLDVKIPADARIAKLVVGDDEPLELVLGGLDPIEEMTGVQMRLKNLGYYDGEIDGTLERETEGALRLFQKSQDLEPTGELDDATRQRLEQEHDSE
jgi:hypothetical protein